MYILHKDRYIQIQPDGLGSGTSFQNNDLKIQNYSVAWKWWKR